MFNLFSNVGQFGKELEILQNVYLTKKVVSSSTYDPSVFDPVVHLFEKLKNRNIDVLIPTKRDVIPDLWDIGEESILIPVNPKETIINTKLPTKFPWEGRSPEFPTAQQKMIIKGLKEIPAYAIVTQENEFVMSVSRDREYPNVVEWLYTKYYARFMWKEDKGPISIALFFMNKEDAILYIQSLRKYDIKTSERGKIRIKKSNLAEAYLFNRTSVMGYQARIVADLEELGKAVFSYIPNKFHNTHIKQPYVKGEFVGTPIYTINLPSTKNTYAKAGIDVMRTEVDQYINRVFFKLEDAYLAWETVCTTNNNARLPVLPSIEVYNLENYLEDLEQTSTKVVKKIKFTPSFRTIRNITLLSEKEEKYRSDKSNELDKEVYPVEKLRLRLRLEIDSDDEDASSEPELKELIAKYIEEYVDKGKEYIDEYINKYINKYFGKYIDKGKQYMGPYFKPLKPIFVDERAENFCKGLFWLLTSDTLPNEDNAW